MGHPTSPLAFRLGRQRHWPARHPSPAAALGDLRSLDPLVAAALGRLVGPIRGPVTLGRHPFGRRRARGSLYWAPAAALEGFLHRRSRRRPLDPLTGPFGHPRPPAARPLPAALGPLWRAALRRLPLRALEGLVAARLAPTPWAYGLRLACPGPRLPPAALLVRHLVRRLARGFPLLRLVNGLFLGRYPLLAKQGLLGVLLRGRGRFTRAQMASVAAFRRGALPLATVDLPLDGAAATVHLKYGSCTVRLWLTRRA